MARKIASDMWKKMKDWLGAGKAKRKTEPGQEAGLQDLSEVRWIPAAENPWGVSVLDLRPITHGLVSTSRDPQCAANAVSFGGDDGLSFASFSPASPRTCEADLRFATDAHGVFDGAAFTPRAMEEKWAIYLHGGRLLFIRSWTRTLAVAVDVEIREEEIRLGRVRGTFTGEDEEGSQTVRILDYLMYSHAMGAEFPAPLFSSVDDPKAAAMLCFSLFGRLASFAAVETPQRIPLSRPFRTDSLLHVAAARGDVEGAARLLKLGVPVSLLARDGLPALQWALGSRDERMVGWLIDQGCDVDVRSEEGATALMTAAQSAKVAGVEELLKRKADVNARDARGFTALHRAAELGNDAIVRMLLAHGADRSIEAQGYTALALAEMRKRGAIAQLLRR